MFGRTVGYGADQIPYLDVSGQLPASTMPSSVTTLLTSLDSQVQAISQSLQDSPWKTTVADQASLPDPASSATGEVRYVIGDGALHAFDGASWQSLAGSGGGPSVGKTMNILADLIAIHEGLTALPGLFYWDTENKEYYVGQGDGSLKALFGEGRLSEIVQEVWIDFRTANLAQMNINITSGQNITQDATFGLELPRTGNKWDAGFSFPDAIFDRTVVGKTFEFVIYTGAHAGEVMVGLVDPTVNLDGLANTRSNQLHEIALHMVGAGSNELFGQFTGTEYIQTYTPTTAWGANKYYKVTFDISTTVGLASNLLIDEVDPADWDTSILNIVNEAVPNNSDVTNLLPAWFVKGTADYYLTGFRVKDTAP